MSSSSPPRSTCTSSPDRHHRDQYTVDAEPRFILDLDRHMAGSSTMSFFDAPPSFQRPPPAHYIGEVVEMECSNVPLNLSVSSNKTKSTSAADQFGSSTSPGQLHSRNFSSSPRDRWNESVTREDHDRNASSSPHNHRNQSSSPATNHSAASFPVNISNSLRFTGNRGSPSSSMLAGNYAHQSINKHSPWTHEQTSINKHSPWTHEETSLNKHSPWTHEQFLVNKHSPWTQEQSSLAHGSSPWASPKILSTKCPESDRSLYHEKVPGQDPLSCGSFPRPQETTSNSWSSSVKAETSLNGAAVGAHHNLPPMVRQNMRTFTAWRSVDVGERSPNQSVDRGSEVMSYSPPLNQNCYSLTGDVRQCHLKETRQESEPRIPAASGTGECEEGIEEHFQRSLGKDYPKCMSKAGANHDTNQPPPSMTSAPAAIEKKNASSVTGAVDDHFAKSLGATWTKIKCLTDSPPTVQTSRHPVHAPGRALSRQLDQCQDSPSRRVDLAWPASGRNQDLSRRVELEDSCNDVIRHQASDKVQDISRHGTSVWPGSPPLRHDMGRHLESNVRYESNTRHDSPKRQNIVFRPELSSRRDADKFHESRSSIDSGIGWETGVRPDSVIYPRASMHHDRMYQDVRHHQDRDVDQQCHLVKRHEYDKQRDSPITNRDSVSQVRQEVNMQQCTPQHSDALQGSRWNKDSEMMGCSDAATVVSLKQNMRLNEQSRVWDDDSVQSEAGLNQSHPNKDKDMHNDVEGLPHWRVRLDASNPRGVWELSQDRAMRPSSGGKVVSLVRPGSAGSRDGRSWRELGAQEVLVNPREVEIKRSIENTPKTLPAEANVSPTSIMPPNIFVRQNSLTLRNENHATDMDVEEEHHFVTSDNKKDADVTGLMNKSLQHSSVVSSYPSKSYLEISNEVSPDSSRPQKSINNLHLSSAVAPLEHSNSSLVGHDASTSSNNSVRSVPALLRDTITPPEAVLRPNTTSITEHNSTLKQSGGEGDNVTRTDSVDDHFAKALGDTWLRLKEAKNEKSSISNPCWSERPSLASAQNHLSN